MREGCDHSLQLSLLDSRTFITTQITRTEPSTRTLHTNMLRRLQKPSHEAAKLAATRASSATPAPASFRRLNTTPSAERAQAAVERAAMINRASPLDNFRMTNTAGEPQGPSQIKCHANGATPPGSSPQSHNALASSAPSTLRRSISPSGSRAPRPGLGGSSNAQPPALKYAGNRSVIIKGELCRSSAN